MNKKHQNNNYSPRDRREQIVKYVLTKGFASIEELMGIFNISRMTIHRDLNELEHTKVIQKIRNGVSAQPTSVFESDFGYREQVDITQKESLCKLASTYLYDGMSIFLDDSSTVIPLIKYFKNLRSLTVITSCLPAINEIIKISGINLIILGGLYDNKYRASYGYLCVDTINRIHADLVIISPHSYKSGSIFESELHIIPPKLAMIENSENKIALIVNSKFKQTSLYMLAKISIFDHIIVDNFLSKNQLDELRSFTKNLLIAKS